jgi:hypothetical protein
MIMRSLFTSVVGECGHRSDLARLSKWSWSYKDWVPLLSRDVFIDRISMGLQYGSNLTGFESRACPWLVQIGWPFVYPTVSLGLLKVHSSRCVVQFWFIWTTCGVCVLNFRRVIMSGRRIICPLQWGFVIEVEANLISTPVSIDAITVLVMVCQFCDVTFVYGESLQWGFGFTSYCFIGCVIGSREEHLCLCYVMRLVP